MDLLTSFLEFSASHQLLEKRERILLAVSGGIDSIVLCELCQRAGIDFTIVHCNFQLRESESDRDEQFVIHLAETYHRPILVKKFETETYAAVNKISIQVAARELRYEWFQLLLKDNLPGENPYRSVATAHHMDDNVETLLMNFFKGTGIAGLRAMLPKQGSIIRPMLFATKNQLVAFAQAEGLSWTEDSSNETDKYTRNYFRHHLIPLVQDRFPEALGNLASNIDRFRDIEIIYRHAIDQHKKKLIEYRGRVLTGHRMISAPTQGAGEVYISVLKLKKSIPLLSIVFEIISDFGFSPLQTRSVVDLLDSPTGKYICSSTHRVLKNRNWLIISPIPGSHSIHILIETPENPTIFDQGVLHFETLAASALPGFLLSTAAKTEGPQSIGGNRKRENKNGALERVAWLDAANIKFPLLLRQWQAGDYFYPLGLRKKKKLGKFFIDRKLSLAEKEKTWVLEMDKKILWVVGMRSDDRFRVTSQTQQAIKISLSPPGMT